MSSRNRPARHAFVLLAAALMAFVGSAALLKANSAVAAQAAGAPDSGLPALGLFVLVVLLGLTGAVLAGMAGKELLDLRRMSHPR